MNIYMIYALSKYVCKHFSLTLSYRCFNYSGLGIAGADALKT